MNPSQRIDVLERKVRQLKIEFERFFNGALETPPESLRAAIQQELKSLRNANLKGVEENFRLSNVEAKFNSYNELFGRRIRDQEEGRGVAARPESGPRHDPDAGVVVGGSVESEAVEALYQSLQRSAGTGPRFDLDSFRSYLDRQVQAIRQKTGCERVVFRVAEEQGKMKLKARPVQEGRGG